jgi:hypothetical protein
MMTGIGEPPASLGEAVFYTTGSGAAMDSGTGGSGTGDTRTQAEKTATLDGDFLVALGEFDEMLLKEEGKVAARVPSQRESGSSGQAGTAGSAGTPSENGASGETGKDGSGEAGEQGEGSEGDAVAGGSSDGQADRSGTAPGTQSRERGAQSSGEGRGGAGDAVTDHSRYGAPGGKLPPPEDDDIVARQLREAAKKEPDPELKEKLWEEYWKYKGVSK